MLPSKSRRTVLVGSLGAFLLVHLFLPLKLHGEKSGMDRSRVLEAMRRAVTYFQEEVAYRGGYAYFYSESLDRRWGEGEVALDTIVVQPPGTPAVGMTLLDAYEATNESLFLDAAKDAARALVLGQLKSGGWSQTIHFGEAKRRGDYRRMPGGEWNASSLDDDQTQSALRFLTRIDKLLKFEDAEIHKASLDGLKSLVDAQFANGAFPQVWTKAAKSYPVMEPQLPSESWRTDARIKNYWDYYTLNDGLAGTVAHTLIVAHQTYQDELYLNSLRKLGDFLVLAQMPEPQPAWAQQYDDQMRPMWARKFEPPAIAGSESQDVIETLLEIARYTSDDKYLKPIPAALA